MATKKTTVIASVQDYAICSQCKYFAPIPGDDEKDGLCHFNPPTVLIDSNDDIGSEWPLVKFNDHCCSKFTGGQ
jgi:hypothetical protein